MKTKNRVSIIFIAVFLSITTAVLGQTELLSDKQFVSSSFVTASGDDFGIEINAPKYSHLSDP